MKNIIKYFLVLMVALIGVVNVFAVPSPPEPTQKTAEALAPISPPGLPIDENIFVLLLTALLLGVYRIHKHQLKTKAPIV